MVSFYICFYKDEKGNAIGHARSGKNAFPEKIGTVIDDNNDDTSVSDLFEIFCTSMMGYLDMLPFIAMIGNVITMGIRASELREFCEEKCLKKERHNNRDIYEMDLSNYTSINVIEDRGKTGQIVGKQVPKMLIIGIVSSLDHQIAQLVKEILKKYPKMISDSDKKVSIRDVFLADDIKEFKEILLDREVESVTRSAFEDQIGWFEEKLGINRKIREGYDQWDSLIEIVERRNLFAHANGIVNNTYLKRVSGSGNIPKLSKGTELFASGKYFKSSLTNIFEFGVKMTQVVWRKLEPDQATAADDALGNLGFSLIERGQYELATRILEFGLSGLKGKKEEGRRRMDIVNLANAYKLSKNDKKANEVLDGEDWSILSDNFAISVAAIREDVDNVILIMNRMAGANADVDEILEEWPVFYHIRTNRKFQNEFKRIFGRGYKPVPQNRYKIIENFIQNIQKNERKEFVSEIEIEAGDKKVAAIGSDEKTGEKQKDNPRRKRKKGLIR